MSAGSLFDLSGCVGVVTGGAGWLGTAMVQALASAGCDVVAVGRDREKLAELAASGKGLRGAIDWVACDVTSNEWPELLGEVTHNRGRVDVLVNNAHAQTSGSLLGSDTESYLTAATFALTAVAESVRGAMPGFEASIEAGGSPSVVNIASMYGLVAPDPRIYDSEDAQNPPYYGAAKAGMIQLTRYAAAELGPRGIRVNAISPGPFPGPAAREDPSFVRRLEARTMLGRVGVPEDLGTALLFLASPASSFVTGTNVVVDGGWTAW